MLQPLGKRIIVRDRKATQEGAIIRPEHVNPAWLEGEILEAGREVNREDLRPGMVVLFSFRAGIVVEHTMGDKVRFLMVEEVMAVVDPEKFESKNPPHVERAADE